MTRLTALFADLKERQRPALVTYIMACDPDFDTSLQIMKGLPESGADIIELGMPFSDPMADGKTIQAAGLRALNKGGSVLVVLKMVKAFRETNHTTPVILMGYYNSVYAYGAEAFCRDAALAGIDGMILVDLPPEESPELTVFLDQQELSLINLITPTSDDERIKLITKGASGFLYYVSIAGITGTASSDLADVSRAIKKIKTHSNLPVCVGFGIKTPEAAAGIGEIADGIVVGSALIEQIEANLNTAKVVTAPLDFCSIIAARLKQSK